MEDNAIFTSSGTSALILTLKALSFPRNSEVIIPAYCCSNVPFSIHVCGLKPIFVDINTEDLLIKKENLDFALSKSTVAIIGIHPFGRTMDLEFISSFSRENNLVFIEDFCQSFGATHEDKLHGEFGDISITSFGRGKIIDIGLGGAIITKDKALKRKIEKLILSLENHTFGIEFEKIRKFWEESFPAYFEKVGINILI